MLHTHQFLFILGEGAGANFRPDRAPALVQTDGKDGLTFFQFLFSALQQHPLGSFPAADLVSNTFVLSNFVRYFSDVVFGLDELVEFLIERVIKFHKIILWVNS